MQNTTTGSAGRHTTTGLLTGVCLVVADYLELDRAVSVPLCAGIAGFLGGAWRRFFGGGEPPAEGPTPLRRP